MSFIVFLSRGNDHLIFFSIILPPRTQAHWKSNDKEAKKKKKQVRPKYNHVEMAIMITMIITII